MVYNGDTCTLSGEMEKWTLCKLGLGLFHKFHRRAEKLHIFVHFESLTERIAVNKQEFILFLYS